jgi:hypothetical protein
LSANVYRIAQTGPNQPWGTWSDLGGTSGGHTGPSVVGNADGRLEVFAQSYRIGFGGETTEAANIFQTAPNGAWGSWGDIGQPDDGGAIALWEPYAGRNKDGRLAVLAKGQGSDQNVWLTQQTGAGVDTWTAWANLGRPSGVYVSAVMSIGWEKDGRLDVFTWGGDYAVYHIMQAVPNGSFGSWVSFGKPSGVNLSSPFVSRNQDGRQEFFAAGSDGNIYHKYQLEPNGSWINWWGDLGRPTGVTLNDPIAGHLADGEQCIFSRGSDNNIWSRCQTCPNCNWGEWSSLGKPSTTNPSDQLATGNSQNGYPSLFVVGQDGHLWVSAWVPLFMPCADLTVNVVPAGVGTVTLDPLPNCSAGPGYVVGTNVELLASAVDPQYDFDHWSGDATGSVNPITILVDIEGDKEVTAHFALPGDKTKVYLPIVIR